MGAVGRRRGRTLSGRGQPPRPVGLAQAGASIGVAITWEKEEPVQQNGSRRQAMFPLPIEWAVAPGPIATMSIDTSPLAVHPGSMPTASS